MPFRVNLDTSFQSLTNSSEMTLNLVRLKSSAEEHSLQTIKLRVCPYTIKELRKNSSNMLYETHKYIC